MSAAIYPFVDRKGAYVPSVKVDDALIVVTITVDVAAKRGLTGAGSGFYQISLSFVERDVLMPYIRGNGVAVGKYRGKRLL